ncbi:MAG: nuclear transport factor 2 family protein [Bacteroidota bacterium]
MNTNEQLINKFYGAFIQKDFQTMADCYHPEATFKDEAFDLKGKQIAAMWRMLIERGKDMKVEFSDVKADEKTGSASWQAWYSFSQTGNQVHNIIQASFIFKDGKIINHHDSFDFHSWSSQSLGLMGKLLGWTSFLQKKVQRSAMKSLSKYISQKPEYQ